jgi:hypothetical protein
VPVCCVLCACVHVCCVHVCCVHVCCVLCACVHVCCALCGQVHGGDSPFLGFLLALAAKPALLASGVGPIPEAARATPSHASGDRLGSLEGTGSGNVAQAIASDAVTVLRTLMSLSGFAPLLQPVLEQAVRMRLAVCVRREVHHVFLGLLPPQLRGLGRRRVPPTLWCLL